VTRRWAVHSIGERREARGGRREAGGERREAGGERREGRRWSSRDAQVGFAFHRREARGGRREAGGGRREGRRWSSRDAQAGFALDSRELMVFEEIIRYSPHRRASPWIAEGFSPTARAA